MQGFCHVTHLLMQVQEAKTFLQLLSCLWDFLLYFTIISPRAPTGAKPEVQIPGGTQAGVSDGGEQPQAPAGRVMDIGWSRVMWGTSLYSNFPLLTMQEANLEKIHLALKANRSLVELDALGAQLMDDIIADCRYFLPVLTVSLSCCLLLPVHLGRDNFYFFPFLPLKKRRSFAHVCFKAG